MSRLWKVIAPVAVALAAVVDASASEPARTPSYGTGVFFDQGKTLSAGDFSIITEGKSTTLMEDKSAGGSSVAEAVATVDRFGLGFVLADKTAGRTAGAQAAAGYTVTGLAGGSVIQGLKFTVAGKVLAKATGAFVVALTVLDYKGNFLAEINFTGERIVDEKTGKVFEKDSFAGMYCPDPIKFTGSCNDPEDPVKQKTVWFSGAGLNAVLPLVLPAANDSGIIAEFWGSSDNSVELDFRHGVTLTGTPRDGVVVTFSTGQTFGKNKRP